MNKIWSSEDEIIKSYSRPKKKVALFLEISQVKIFHHLPARIVVCVSEYTFFVPNKKNIHRNKKYKKLKKIEKQKKAKEEKEKENVVVFNNI